LTEEHALATLALEAGGAKQGNGSVGHGRGLYVILDAPDLRRLNKWAGGLAKPGVDTEIGPAKAKGHREVALVATEHVACAS
jgi:hypothetical protein